MKLHHLATAFLATASLAIASPEIGKPAPEFTLTDAKGTSHSLSDYKGKFVVLEWVNFGCPFVKKFYDAGAMQDLQAKHTGDDVVWLSICSSAEGKQGYLTPEELQAKLESIGYKGTGYLIDAEGTVGQSYDAKTTPEMFVINPEGILVYKGAIDNKPTPHASDLDGATNYVSAALGEAKSGGSVTTAQTKSYGCSVKY